MALQNKSNNIESSSKQELIRQRYIGASFIIAIIYAGNLISYLIPPREDDKTWLSFLSLLLMAFVSASKPNKIILNLTIITVILGIVLRFLLK